MATDYLLALVYISEFHSPEAHWEDIMDDIVQRKRPSGTAERGGHRPFVQVPMLDRIAKGSILALNHTARAVSNLRNRCMALANILKRHGQEAWDLVSYRRLVQKVRPAADKFLDDPIEETAYKDEQSMRSIAGNFWKVLAGF